MKQAASLQPSILGELLSMLKPHRGRIAVALAVLLGALGATLAGPALVGYAINDGLVRQRSFGVVSAAGAAYAGVACAFFFLTRWQTLLVSSVGEEFLAELRQRVFNHLLDQPLEFFESESSGQLLSRMTADIDTLESLVQSGLSSFVTSMGLLVTSLVVLCVMSPALFGVVVVSLIPVTVASLRYRVSSTRAYGKVRDLIGSALAGMEQDLATLPAIQAFRLQERVARRFASENAAQLEGELETVRLSSRFFPKVEASGLLAAAVVLAAGAAFVRLGITNVGTVAAFVLYLGNLFAAIVSLSALFDLLQSSGAALRTVFGLLRMEPSMVDPEDPKLLPERGPLELISVEFSYDSDLLGGSDAKRAALEGIDLRVEPGERVVVVGPTGGGKSTLAKIIGRLYDPEEGAVRFGGVDLRQVPLTHLRQRIVVLPQEGFLFRGSVAENVALGRQNATREDALAALEQLGLSDWVSSLPSGADTEVGERGSRLSAGERQLVALARVALADPAVVVLDEATSSLDPLTQRRVEKALDRLSVGRTVIVVAHRLDLAREADRVAVVSQGTLVEVGGHEELLEANGYYATLYSAWAASEAEEAH